MPDSELTVEVTNQVAAAVRNGEYPQRALVRLGITGVEARRWLQAGESRDQEGQDDSDPYVRLWQACDVAEADCEMRWIRQMEAAAACTSRTARVKPQDYMLMLSARFPERWSMKADRVRAKAGETLEDALKRMQAAAAE